VTSSPFVEPLREADAFQKNVFLIFNDIVDGIREKTLSATVIDRHWESSCKVYDSKNSEHVHLYIFEIAGQYRFVQILVKAQDNLLRDSAAQYKAVCAKLNLDPVVPLLLIYVRRFVEDGPWIRRRWANNTVLLDLPNREDIKPADPNSFDWNQPVRIQSPAGTDSQYCEDATIRLRRLTEIHDQNEIGVIVDELLNLAAHVGVPILLADQASLSATP
jgi:hypothetical protein